MILKVAEMELDYATRDYEFMRMEGAVNAALAPHPLVVGIYGFCALSMFSEAMVRGDIEGMALPTYQREECEKTLELDQPQLIPMNKLEPNTKLEWALNMAEAVALLHNHERGVMVHDDIQLSQFMIAEDGNLKMGDFNRAEVSIEPKDCYSLISSRVN